MARPATITNERLLHAARAEFLERGIRATSSGIARRAGVSAGILFHRFGSKAALFAAAMNEGDAGSPRKWPIDLRLRVGKGTVRQTLVEFGQVMLERFSVIVPSQVMAWANPDPGGRVSVAEQYRTRAVRGHRYLVAYLRAESRLKRVRTVDFYTVAQAFMGALWFFVFERVSGAALRSKAGAPSRGEVVRRLVDTLWRGLHP